MVAVRAMAPVAGKPPNSAEARLAQPCARISALGRWLVPINRSATMAESSDSIPARKAMVSDEGSNSINRAMVMWGKTGAGR